MTECTHEKTELRVKTNAAGIQMFKLQCLNCGNGVGDWISKAKIRNVNTVAPWDDSIAEAVEAERVAAFQERQLHAQNEVSEKSAQWWAEYDLYLQSMEWRAKSRRVIARDVVCQSCLERPAAEAHHLTYDHVYNEPFFDLVGVCRQCHGDITRMDRERRASA